MRSAARRAERTAGQRTAVPRTAAATAPAVLLASEGRSIPADAVQRAAILAEAAGGSVRVLVIARIWGTSLGFPNPGLNPSRQEWEQSREVVRAAVDALERAGVPAFGRVVGTRGGAKLVMQEALRLGCAAIVMGADAKRSRIVADFMWSQEPQRVARRAGKADLPVYLVPDP